MSSTNRGAVRSESDFYATPPSATEAFFRWLGEESTKVTEFGKVTFRSDRSRILDPCAGDGAILRVAKYTGRDTLAVELRDPCRIPLEAIGPTWIGDALGPQDWSANVLRGCAIVTNPPYGLAQEFIETWRPRVRWSAWLTRLGFLASQKRAAWFTARPPDHVLILPKRPSFTGKGTDSCDYAWVVWDNDEWLSHRPRGMGWLDAGTVTP